MNKKRLTLTILSAAFLSPLFLAEAANSDLSLFSQGEKRPILVNNRILAKVNGKAISVIDIMKKMDMLFYRQFPEYTSSSEARLQFYEANWESALQDFIDMELIRADAEESKLTVSKGDIRQELETRFGPNIIANLDKIGLTFDEAWKMIHDDIIMRRMLYMKAHAKALHLVTPEVMRKAYEDYAQAHMRPTVWIYRVISFRDKELQKAEKAATEAYHLLQNGAAIAALKNIPVESSTKLTISEEFRNADSEVSPAYKESLSLLQPTHYSAPVASKSRVDSSTVYRIFFLKEKIEGGKIPFSEIGLQIKDDLLNAAAAQETEEYLQRLRKHFDLQSAQLEELKAERFQPFAL